MDRIGAHDVGVTSTKSIISTPSHQGARTPRTVISAVTSIPVIAAVTRRSTRKCVCGEPAASPFGLNRSVVVVFQIVAVATVHASLDALQSMCS
jgi:hypothetical protein